MVRSDSCGLTVLGAMVLWAGVAAAGGQGVQPGDKAPAITLEALSNLRETAGWDGELPEAGELSWDEFGGATVVLEFWGTWCGPCVAAIPHLNELQEEVADEDFVFLAVTFEDVPVIDRFLTRAEMRSWVGHDTDRSMVGAFGFRGWPTTFIARKGRVVGRTHPSGLSAADLRAYAEGRVDEPDAGAAEEPAAAEQLGDPGESRRRHPGARIGHDPFNWAEQEPTAQVIVRPAEDPTGGTRAWGPSGSSMMSERLDLLMSHFWGVPIGRVLLEGFGDAALERRWDVFLTPGDLPREAARAILAHGLGVTVTREERPMPIYRIRIADDGLKLKPGLTTEASGSSMSRDGDDRMHFAGTSIPWSGLVDLLGMSFSGFQDDWVIEDESGVDPDRLFFISLALDPPLTPENVSRQLREQVGVELVEARGDREVLVVRPAEDAEPVAAGGE